MLNIPVVLGTVRQKRKSIFPAKLVVESLTAAGVKSQLVDFKELPLPFLDSPKEPSGLNKKYPYPNVQKWSGIADSADAFVFIVPEYNHGFPAVLKNALDWLYSEFEHKPVGLVGVSSGVVGGARAIEHIRPIVETFSMFAIRETVMFGKVQDLFDQQGTLLDESYIKKIDRFIQSLLWSVKAIKMAK